ncbi:hypothetical protein L7F22_037520 [Adiantum nelumboides]|nr:hypothetical protein [Adiantum nelumboides]
MTYTRQDPLLLYSMERFLLALVALSLATACASLRCPSSCSFISPVPYPFGAAPGCGLPGFQLSNCSQTPQWNLLLSETPHIYYVRSIQRLSNSNNQSLGYGGYIILSLIPNLNTPFCEISMPRFLLTAFSSSNLYAFESANLTFFEDKYLFFNCTGSALQAPTSGVFKPSSSSCRNFLQHCNYLLMGHCLEYAPYKDLYLPTLLNAYNCSSFRRFIIADDDDPVETWITGTKFAWGPVQDVDSCTRCQRTGGTCGYDIGDNSFLCYCDDDDVKLTDCNEKKPGNKRVVIGASIAAISVLVVAIIVLCIVYRHYYWWVFGNRKRLRLDSIHQGPIDFPYGALVAATRNFNTEIGRGAFGKVYRGTLPDGNEVAVKILDPSMSHSNDQFLNEVGTIGSIHHVNVARLFGYCFSKSKRILVYEYVSNGSLDKHLFSSAPESQAVLYWKQRFNIALGIARGLCYMHEECRNCIVHCDIKPQNILLDAAYCPKIADFGLAKLLSREESRVLTQARGTPGYVAPEFWSLGSGPLTAKFDVYSYGMMLLEIVRGKRSFHQCDPFSLEESDEEVDDWMSVSVDGRLMDDVNSEQARICTLVALWCIQADPSLRPTMSKVVQYLQGTAEVPVDVPSPFGKMYRHKKKGSELRLLSSISSEEVIRRFEISLS